MESVTFFKMSGSGNDFIILVTRSGESLAIYFSKKDHVYSNIHLEGDARIIYTGKLWQDAWKS